MFDIQCGDIIFIHGKGIIPRLIEFFDKGRFSHVCICIGESKIIESQYFKNTQIVTNPYSPEESTVLKLDLTDEQKQKLVEILPIYSKDKYDFKQIIGILLHDLWKGLKTNISWNNPKELICSELVVDLLHDIGYLSDSEYQSLLNITPNLLFTYLYNRLKQVS